MRFVSRFSREKVRGLLKRGGPHVQRGEDFGGFSGKLENLGFPVLQNSEKSAPGAGSSSLVSKTAPSRARPIKNVLADPDAPGGLPETSGTARIFFWSRAREGEICDTEVEDPAPGADLSDFPKT